MAFSGQARTQALQRVHRSRSIGFSCCQLTSNAPSQPASPVMRPDQTGYFRSSGSSPARPVMSTLTLSCPARRSAQSSAASAGPMISTSPADLNSTAGVGSGSGSAAMAMSAASFGVACSAFAPQPPCSRTLTNLRLPRAPACSASSPKSAASCVQATMTSSPAASAAWNAATSLRQSCSCTTSGAPLFNPLATAAASTATVRLQLQTLSVLPSRLILLFFPQSFLIRALSYLRLGRFRFRLCKKQPARLVERREHLLRYRFADRPVARIGFERIRHIEVRIVEQLLQREPSQLVLHLRVHEEREIGLRRQALDRRHGGRRLGFRRRRFRFRRRRVALQARPACEKRFVVVRHYTRSLGCW